MLCVVLFVVGATCGMGWAQCHDSVSFGFAMVVKSPGKSASIASFGQAMCRAPAENSLECLTEVRSPPVSYLMATTLDQLMFF